MEDSEKGEDIVPKAPKAYTDGVFLIPSLFLGTDPKDRSNQKRKKKIFIWGKQILTDNKESINSS